MKNIVGFKLLLFSLFTIILSTCNSNERSMEENINIEPLPFFGFNAKGNMEPDQQTTYTNNYFDKITSVNIKKNIPVRVTGGTASQTTYPIDWTDENINKWISLQKKQGIRLIYVVNGNDSPASQALFIKKWLNAGAKFDFIEMMNEYYLPKFLNGDTSYEEVTEVVTPEKYVDIILPRFWAELDQFNLPYFLIFAPERVVPNPTLKHWNEVVADAIKTKYPNRNLNATIHLYIQDQSDISQFDYKQIDNLRNSLPANRSIAITEAGVINPTLTYQQVGDISIEHYKKILPHLKSGDYLLDQILYNTAVNNNTAALNPVYNGETPKGTSMLQFILNQFK